MLPEAGDIPQGKDKECPSVRAEGWLMLAPDLTDFSTLTQRSDRAYWGCIWA